MNPCLARPPRFCCVAPDATPARIAAELAPVAARQEKAFPESYSGLRYSAVVLHEALVAAGVESTLCLIEGADHGFVHDPSRPAHRADDAADAWRRAMAFLNGQPAS